MHSLQKVGIHQQEHICKHSISGFNDLLVRRPKTAFAVRAPLLQGDRDLGAAGYNVWGLKMPSSFNVGMDFDSKDAVKNAVKQYVKKVHQSFKVVESK